jgi:hypothetical protein
VVAEQPASARQHVNKTSGVRTIPTACLSHLGEG